MEDRTFTQEEVNGIVQERLAREKAKYDQQLIDMQADINRREKRLQALEKLKEEDLPAELVELVRTEDDESFNKSIELLKNTYKSQNSEVISRSVQNYRPMSGSSATDPIREAMGLKR